VAPHHHRSRHGLVRLGDQAIKVGGASNPLPRFPLIATTGKASQQKRKEVQRIEIHSLYSAMRMMMGLDRDHLQQRRQESRWKTGEIK